MQQLQELSDELEEVPSQYTLECEGSLGLNALLLFAPEKICFRAAGPSQLEYMRLIVELVLLCGSAEEWISRTFARPVNKFLEDGHTLFPFSKLELQGERFSGPREQLKRQLNEYTQWAYLDQKHDAAYLKETLSMLSSEGQKSYKNFLFPYIERGVCLEIERCQRLLPCWPFREQLPFSSTAPFGRNIYGERELNTNTFHYGNLWLASDQTFLTVKKNILHASHQFEF